MYPKNAYPPPLSIGTPLVSIIMPVYNAAPYLAECLRSVLAQSYTAWELLLVDNGSTDDSLAVANRVRDPRITLLHEPLKGVSRARNKGLGAMKGEFFCFLDADDILPVHSIRQRLELFRRFPDARFSDGAMQAFNTFSGRVEWVRSPWWNGPPRTALLHFDGSCFVGNTWMVRRKPGETYRLPEHMDHSEDHAFYFSISGQGRYVSTPRVVLQYRKGHASAFSHPLGGHKGYMDLFKWIMQMEPKPTQAQLEHVWRHMRRVMYKDLLKSGKLLRALRMRCRSMPNR